MAANSTLDKNALSEYVDKRWKDDVIPQLEKFIAIPNQSPFFDAEWATNGYMDEAVKLCMDWAEAQKIEGFKMRLVREGDKTPCVLCEIAPTAGQEERGTVLLYSHIDKQPPLTEDWDDDLGPYKPVIKDGKLYGRGGADDGYGLFAALTAIKAMQEQGVPHGRLVLLSETCEESGSRDLPFYLDHLAEEIGSPKLIVCLDSGCGNYDQLWITTSLRGAVVGTLRVKILNEGVHSGLASGIVPSSFRIIRQLLNRIEDADTGVVIDDFHVEIPEHRLAEAREAAGVLGDSIHQSFPFVNANAKPVGNDNVELLLNRTWRPQLSYIGVGGIPPVERAGNVLRSETQLTLSMRLPPIADAEEKGQRLKEILEANPPYGAEIEFTLGKGGSGFDAPKSPEWLNVAIQASSEAFWGKPALCEAQGGSIPFMGLLGKKFPEASFAITGVLGPNSNAHGPNEFLHIQMSANICKTVAVLLESV